MKYTWLNCFGFKTTCVPCTHYYDRHNTKLRPFSFVCLSSGRVREYSSSTPQIVRLCKMGFLERNITYFLPFTGVMPWKSLQRKNYSIQVLHWDFWETTFYYTLYFNILLIPWTNHVSLTLECVAKSVKLPLPNIAVAVKFFLCCEGHWQDSDDIIVMIIAHDLTDRPPLSCTFKCPFLCYHLNT